MNTKLKRYLISSGISFLTGFAVVVLANIETVTLESFTNGAVVGLLFAALRAGFKGLLETLLSASK